YGRLPPLQHDRERKRFGLQRHGGSRRPNRIAAGRVYRGARVVDHRTAGGRDRRIPQEGFVMRPFSLALATLLGAALIGGCTQEPPKPPPPPAEVDSEATGHYCGMLLVDHEGPKGQIHLASRSQPIWFSSVRDTIAFTRLPEEPRDITAIYVNDMARATQWEQPEPGAWVDAREAWFVIESE